MSGQKALRRSCHSLRPEPRHLETKRFSSHLDDAVSKPPASALKIPFGHGSVAVRPSALNPDGGFDPF
jgi:hypothetical protein